MKKVGTRFLFCAAMLALLVLLALLWPIDAAGQDYALTCRAARVVDGDTIKVDCPNMLPQASNRTVRLLGLDAPEISRASEEEEAEGRVVKALVEELLQPHTWVRLQCVGRDPFGRDLCGVFRDADGLDINAWLLRNGLAEEAGR